MYKKSTTQRLGQFFDGCVGDPFIITMLTLFVIFICTQIVNNWNVSETYVNSSLSDVLVRTITNGSNHAHPWLATSVTLVVLVLIIVVIILYAGELDTM